MSGNITQSKITNTALVSRFERLACETKVVIDKTIHAVAEVLDRGTLLAKNVTGGKYRAYAEGIVKSGGAFATSAATFTLDVATSPLAKHLRVGDVIESTAAAALGTILTYDPVTGVGTLTGNSTSALTAGNKVRIAVAQAALASSAGKILQDEIVIGDAPAVGSAFFEGFFVLSQTTITTAALTALGGITIESDEIRLK